MQCGQSDKKHCHLNSLVPPRPSNPPKPCTHRRRNQQQTVHSEQEQKSQTHARASTHFEQHPSRMIPESGHLQIGREGLSRGIQGKGFQHTVAVLMTPPLDPSRAMARDTAFTTKSCTSKATTFSYQLETLGFTTVTCSAAARRSAWISQDAAPISRVD